MTSTCINALIQCSPSEENKDPGTELYLAEAYAKAGETKKARAILKQLKTDKAYVSPTGLAIIHAALGENEKTLKKNA